TGANYNGLAATTWAVDATPAATAGKVVARDSSGNFFAGRVTAAFTGELTGNASTATKWKSARTITIGNTTKIFDGTGNVAFAGSEIGGTSSPGMGQSFGHYHWTNGILIKTNLGAATNTMVNGTITGNSYGGETIRTDFNFYNYTNGDAILNAAATAHGEVFPISFFALDGFVCMWFKQNRSSSSFQIKLFTGNNQAAAGWTLVGTNVVLPVTGVTRLVTVTPRKTWNSETLKFGTAATNMSAGNHTHTASQVGLGNVPNTTHTAAATASTVVLRDSAADITTRLFRSNYANQTTISGAMAFRVNNGTDNYIRYCSDPAAIRTWLGASASGGDAAYVKKAGDSMAGKLLIQGTQTPTITLALGDGDTGFKWNSDGNFDIYANNVSIGNFVSTGIALKKNVNVTGSVTTSSEIRVNKSGKYAIISPDNVTYAHYKTDANNGHHFNKNVYVTGNIYCGTAYANLVWSTANLAFGTANGNMARGDHTHTAAQVGLGSVSNWGSSSAIGANSVSQYATTNMVAQVRAEKANVGHTHTPAQVGLGNVANFGNSSAIGDNSTSRYATTNMVAQVRAEKVSKGGDTMTGTLTTSKIIDNATNFGKDVSPLITIATGGWSKPIGFTSMITNTSVGRPSTSDSHGYWTVLSKRDTAGGYSGFFTGYSTQDIFYGNGGTSSVNPTWAKVFTSLNKPNSTDVGLGNVGNYSAVNKAGDTMTGTLFFSNSGNSFRGIQGTMADNDHWRIGGFGSGSNNGFMEIATADDQNEAIYVRQYTGLFASLARTATLLDASGNSTFPGNVTAYSDIKLKTDIRVIENAMTKISTLSGYTYTRKDTGSRHSGVIAQEVQKVLPEVIQISKAMEGDEDQTDTLSVAYGNMVGLLIEGIKELKREIDELKSQLGK
ncbi:MAG: tail fiber domain-containing protein, partial [Fusobacteriaceae bacterium]